MSDGFGLEPDVLGSLANGMGGIGDSLGQAGQAIGGELGGDFGHPTLNSVVGQAIGAMHTRLGELGTHAGSLSSALIGAQQAYGESEDAAKDTVVNAVFNPPASSTPDTPPFTLAGDNGENPLLL